LRSRFVGEDAGVQSGLAYSRQLLTERYRERLAGVLSCYDRIIVTGTLPGACYAKGNGGISFCTADPDLRLSAVR
jgi:hypothetical protein